MRLAGPLISFLTVGRFIPPERSVQAVLHRCVITTWMLQGFSRTFVLLPLSMERGIGASAFRERTLRFTAWWPCLLSATMIISRMCCTRMVIAPIIIIKTSYGPQASPIACEHAGNSWLLFSFAERHRSFSYRHRTMLGWGGKGHDMDKPKILIEYETEILSSCNTP